MTGGRGLLFDEGPTACPFIALDRDRERRADEPDSRHRCYATPTPEPRALAHQRNFCLTPNFSACPIFQDWAIRAAARPVPLRPVPPALALTEEARPVGEPELTLADEVAPEEAGTPEQVSLFDDRPPGPPVLPAAPPMPTFRLTAPAEEAVTGGGGATIMPAPGPAIPPPERPARVMPPTVASAATARPAASAAPPKPTPSKPIKTKPTLRREDIVPSWERAHYDVPDVPRSPYGGRRLFSRLTVLLAVLAIIALAIVVVFFVPVLFHAPAATTPQPTQSSVLSPTVPSTSATAAPTPQSTWLTYTIKVNDNLYRIAAQFGITYDQLLAANPQITNPNYIRAGDVINIPPPDFQVPSPSASAGHASASP